MPRAYTLLIFPHQLFREHPGLELGPARVLLIEEDLFFADKRYPVRFHKQKLWLHRASMTRYHRRLHDDGFNIEYVERGRNGSTLRDCLEEHTPSGSKVCVADPHDHELSRRLREACEDLGLTLEILETPMFLNSSDQNEAYRAERKRWFMADFYKHQRRRLGLLMEGGKPLGGRWSFDKENRKKVPRKLLGEIPRLELPERDEIDEEARQYVLQNFPQNPGSLEELIYPTSHADAERWLKNFLARRFERFGPYEDAMVQGERWLWHSVLTPMLNIGLLTPGQIIAETMSFAEKHAVAPNSVEGFVRQIIGWREFIRATYAELGVSMRNGNHWDHRRSIPRSFYDGTTGIPPIDDVIHRVLETGYCHHIERLMVLGGFMFLCEFDPKEIYLWFMEMFVDSYDWVMVPNVYAMSQHADGGQITTKPYFSGSAYIRKMSNHPAGDWTAVWDALYWRWIINHSGSLAKNPRWAMMCAMAMKMNPDKRQGHLTLAEAYLSELGKG